MLIILGVMRRYMDDQIYQRNYLVHREFYPHVKSFADECTGRVLDIGCGNRRFEKWFDATQYVGVDFDSNFGDPDIVGDALTLPFQADSFDHCVSTQVLEHVTDPFQFFNEIRRVVKPGGTCCVTTNQMYPIHMAPHDYFRFTPYGLEVLINDSRMRILKQFQGGSLPMRVCSEVNYVIDAGFPDIISNPMILLMNLMTFPVRHISFRPDHVLVGAIFEIPQTT